MQSVAHFVSLWWGCRHESGGIVWMASGDFSTSADPPSLDLPSKSLTSAAKCRDRGSGEHFGLL